jgi:hypothetical protein
LTSSLRAILIGFAVLALIAGVMLFIGAARTEDYFSWTIEPPLTAATLGAFYWAALVLFAFAAAGRRWPSARVAAYPVAAIAVVLLVVTLVHLDRFDMDSLFGWFWLIAYCVAPPLLAWAIYEQLRAPGQPGGGSAEELAPRPLPPALRVALGAEAAVMLVAAAVLLLAPGEAADLWPWALTPLTSRALGAFVLGIALAALVVIRDDDASILGGAAAAYVALGVLQLLAAGLHSEDFGGDDLATAAYLAFLGAVLVTGAYGSIAARASSRS